MVFSVAESSSGPHSSDGYWHWAMGERRDGTRHGGRRGLDFHGGLPGGKGQRGQRCSRCFSAILVPRPPSPGTTPTSCPDPPLPHLLEKLPSLAGVDVPVVRALFLRPPSSPNQTDVHDLATDPNRSRRPTPTPTPAPTPRASRVVRRCIRPRRVRRHASRGRMPCRVGSRAMRPRRGREFGARPTARDCCVSSLLYPPPPSPLSPLAGPLRPRPRRSTPSTALRQTTSEPTSGSRSPPARARSPYLPLPSRRIASLRTTSTDPIPAIHHAGPQPPAPSRCLADILPRRYLLASSFPLDTPTAPPGPQPILNPDPTLNALVQLGALRLDCKRSFVSLIDREHQYVVAEMTRSHSIKEIRHDPGDMISFGVCKLEACYGVCPTTMKAFLDETGEWVRQEPNCIANRTRYIVNDFRTAPGTSPTPCPYLP